MRKGPYKGWYKISNTKKFIPPLDSHMKSFNIKNGTVQYKSSLELKMFTYCDTNTNVTKWSIEPFPIKYLKPTDGKLHRYYIDVYLQLASGHKMLVEIKPKDQTKPPRPPRNPTPKSKARHAGALRTYAINEAKWEAAKQYASDNKMIFAIVTEAHLN